jgi:Calcineurin-like phosphoesterase
LAIGGMIAGAPARGFAQSSASVVAIGDVHGDFDDFVTILQRASLIDKQNHWSGGKTTFVQVGDVIDRGPKPRPAMDLIMSLEQEATKDGGRVIPLFGNHEIMNIMGDLRYVTPENYASFADGDSEKRRQAAFKQYMSWRDNHAAILAELPQPMEMTEAEWMTRHPLGYVEQREAYSPNGNYGKWLRGHSAVAQVGDSIFLHGGISPATASMKLDAINSRVRDEIKAFDSVKQFMQEDGLILPFFNLQEMVGVAQAALSAERKSRIPASSQRQDRLTQFLGFQDWLMVRPDGPLWFRGYDSWNEQTDAAQVDKILKAFKVNHIVVGHTVQKSGTIRARFGGKIFLIDTGMLSSYYPGGKASALVIQGDGTFIAMYTDGQVTLVEPAKSSRGIAVCEVRSFMSCVTELSSSAVPRNSSQVPKAELAGYADWMSAH